MKILPKYKVRNVAGETIVMVQGANPGDMTTVIALNETSLFLWNNLYGKEFEMCDVAGLLTENYDVDLATAEKDADRWLSTLRERVILG